MHPAASVVHQRCHECLGEPPTPTQNAFEALCILVNMRYQ